MAKHKFMQGALCLAVGFGSVTPAFAGGLERGGYNIDLLFDTSRITTEATATYVAPQRKLKNAVDGPAGGDLNSIPGFSSRADESEGYWVPRVGVKFGFTDQIDCMADYSQPWGAHLNPGSDWRGANHNIETKVESDNYALTCSYKFDVGEKGQFRLIGGGFYQELEGFKTRLVQYIPPNPLYSGVGRLDLKADGWGWRAGVAYEIPEYAFRASVVYNSEVDLDDITGAVDLTGLPPLGAPAGLVTPVFGAAKMPDSVELKLQSGVAPGWLVFGSVKWTDWSQLQSISFCPTATRGISCTSGGPTELTSLDLMYRDGWTIVGGVGHKFDDQWSGALTATWDRGTSDGLGSQTDSWIFGAAVSYAPNQNVELRLAGALGVLTSGSSGTVTRNGITYGEDVSYDFGNDLVAAISTQLKVKF